MGWTPHDSITRRPFSTRYPPATESELSMVHPGGLRDEPLVVGTPTHDPVSTVVVARKIHPSTANPTVLRYDSPGRNVGQPRPIEETPCELVKGVRRPDDVRLVEQTLYDGTVGVGEPNAERVGFGLGLVGSFGVDEEVGLKIVRDPVGKVTTDAPLPPSLPTDDVPFVVRNVHIHGQAVAEGEHDATRLHYVSRQPHEGGEIARDRVVSLDAPPAVGSPPEDASEGLDGHSVAAVGALWMSAEDLSEGRPAVFVDVAIDDDAARHIHFF